MTETMTEPQVSGSPFVAATSQPKRLKVLAYGASGVGKTTFGLSFPRPVVIDTEGGSDLYGERSKFDVLRTASFDEALTAVRWLKEHPHPYRTALVDPVTILWDSLQRKWSDIFLKRNKQSKGYRFEFYNFEPRDWMTIKAEWKDLLRELLALDTTVIVTAREKTLYGDTGFMQPIGQTYEAEKGLAYAFDVVLRLVRDSKGKFLAEVVKDRSGKLPTEPFEHSYAVFARLFGEETFTREAKAVVPATDEQRAQLRDLINALGISQDQINKRCAAHGAEGLHDLSSDAAAAIIEKWAAALAARQNTNPSPKGD